MSNSRAASNFRARRREDKPNMLPTGGREYNNPWWKEASCKGIDVETFYDETSNIPVAMLKMCFDCPVVVTCRLAGYAEYHGVWGLTRPYWRDERRHQIFARLMGNHLGNVDDLASFRREIYALIEEGKDVVASMREAGFNEDEINLFLTPSPMEEKAIEHLDKQATFTTDDQTYKKARAGVVFANP